jgi:hypothetical protein
MTRKRLTPPEKAWAPTAVYKAVNPEKQEETAPFSIDAVALANALGPKLVLPQPASQCTRSLQDERLIISLVIGIAILGFTSLICALISVFVVTRSFQAIGKLLQK